MLALRRAVASIASSHARKPAPPVSISEPRTGDCAASRMAARQKAVTDKPSDSAAATTCARSSSVSACWSWTASRMALPSKLGWSRVQRGGDGVHLGALLGGQHDVTIAPALLPQPNNPALDPLIIGEYVANEQPRAVVSVSHTSCCGRWDSSQNWIRRPAKLTGIRRLIGCGIRNRGARKPPYENRNAAGVRPPCSTGFT